MKTRRKTGTGRTGKAALRSRPAAARKSGKATVTALAADCTIAQTRDIKSQLAKVITRPSPVTLDLSGVRRIDTAGFQVLVAFIRDRRTAGRDVQCQGASESFCITASLLGLGALFGPVMDDRLLAPAAGAA